MIQDSVLEHIVIKIRDWGKDNKKVYFSDEQEKTAKHAKELSYHAVFGTFPESIIKSAAPNETEEEFKYRKENYKQVTKPSWDKALTFVYRIWNKQNYSIEINEEYKEYFTDDYPKHENYLSFFRDVVTKKKLSDPNSVAVVKPYYIPTKEVEEDGEIYEVVDQSEEISPVLCIYDSKDVFIFEEGELCVVKKKENTEVVKNGSKVKEGMWFEVYGKDGIYYLKQYGDYDKFLFEVEEYYEHGYGSLPAWRLGGIPVSDGDAYYYHSYFSGALPNLDQAVFLSSTLFASIVKHGFPTRWYYEDDCAVCNGTGWEMDYEKDDKVRCSGCGGDGKKFTFSWGKDYKIQLPENTADAGRFDVGSLPSPPFGTESPDTNVLEFLDNKTKDLIETAFANLNIDISNTPNGQTATESKIDREEAFSFLLQFSYELFDLLGKSMNAMIFMRWGSEDFVKITAPNEFTIRSSDALTTEFSEAQTAGLPSPYLSKLLLETTAQRFNNKGQERLLEVVSNVDQLMTKNDVQIASMKAIGAIQQWQVVLHANIFGYIGEIMSEDEDFLEGDIYKDILPKLKERAQQDVITGADPNDTLARLIQ